MMALRPSRERRLGLADRWLTRVVSVAGVVCAAIVVLIFGLLIVESLSAIRTVGLSRFLTDASWHPASGAGHGRFNLTPMLLGTLLAAGGAILIAGPLGLIGAVFARFYAPRWLRPVFRRVLELLAGVPSVVWGLWGLVVLAPMIGRLHPPGQSLLAAILILSVMILPTVALLSESALWAVPNEPLQAAYAMGFSRPGVILGAALPAARSGIASAFLLATARAIGETMAVLMVAGNVVQVPGGLFDPVRTITANIALELGYATDQHRSALFVSGLALMVLVVGLVALNEVVRRSLPND